MLLTEPEQLILHNQVRIMQALSLLMVPENRTKPHWPSHQADMLGDAIETTINALKVAQIIPPEPR